MADRPSLLASIVVGDRGRGVYQATRRGDGWATAYIAGGVATMRFAVSEGGWTLAWIGRRYRAAITAPEDQWAVIATGVVGVSTTINVDSTGGVDDVDIVDTPQPQRNDQIIR